MVVAGGALDIVIRRAGSEDVHALASVGRRSFIAAYGHTANQRDLDAFVDSCFSPTAVAAEMGLAGRGYLLATVDGMAAGLAKWREEPCPSSGAEREAIEIQQLYVLPDRQRLGLGARLVDRVISIGRDRSVRGVWLLAWEQADWATTFYQKVGFRPIGKAEFRIGSTLYTDLVMWLPIRAGA